MLNCSLTSLCPIYFNTMLLLEHSFKASHSCARINIKKKTFPQISVRFNRQENTAKMPFKKVTHVIFDVDGLLLESESAYDKIVVEMIKPYGKIYTNEVKIKTLGVPEPDTAAILIKELQLPLSASEFLEIYQSKVKHFLQNPPLMPGAKRLVEHLHNHKVPLAVATSSAQQAMEIKTKNHQDLFKLFHHIVCGSTDPEVKNGKPAPDIFLVCASRFPDKPSPDQCLVFEDSPKGATGALAAGMQAVLVPDPIIPKEDRKPATLVINSLMDFKPELFGLPTFDS